MHPDADALLDAIFDAPDDDTPRLVYADWLQENGQEAYAQFIRLQCAAAREKLWSDEANRLWEEIGPVWTKLDEEWRPATRDDLGLDAVHFHRGFFSEKYVLTYRELIRYGSSCWPWLPLPTTTLQPDDEAEHEVLTFTRLSRIRRLRLLNWYDDHLDWHLLDSPQLSNLEVLDLSAGAVPASDAEAMLGPDLYPRLRELRLKVYDDDAGRTGADAPELQNSPSARYLRDLRRRLEERFEKVVWPGNP